MFRNSGTVHIDSEQFPAWRHSVGHFSSMFSLLRYLSRVHSVCMLHIIHSFSHSLISLSDYHLFISDEKTKRLSWVIFFRLDSFYF